jgi:four helix bundle protein
MSILLEETAQLWRRRDDGWAMNHFDHEKLDAYRAAIEFVGVADRVLEQMPTGRAYLKDQLARAALSVVNNTAEGAGEFRPSDKARFYRMACRSATECAGILDVCRELELADEALRQRCRELLLRIVSMLTRLAKTHQRPRSGTGTGTGTGTEAGH